MKLNMEMLISACSDDSADAGIIIRSDLEPLTGPGGHVKPATYAGGKYQADKRWIGDGEERAPHEVVVIDNPPSQANRLEAQLERLASDLGLPNIVLDLSDHPLPPHLPKTLSAYRFPHRNADAYLKDSTIDGIDFNKSEMSGLMKATSDNPLEILRWMPQALLFGFWQSHLGKKGSQAKLARSWVSEIYGVDPAAPELKVLGIKGDPLNLSGDDRVVMNEADGTWVLQEGEKKAKVTGGEKAESLARVGHGQVPFKSDELSLGALSFRDVVQQSAVSFASLRRVWVGSPEENSASRALLVSLGLVAHVAAFARPFSLRSGCDLRPHRCSWTWLGASSDQDLESIDIEEAKALFLSVVGAAERVGLPVGSAWRREPLILKPNAQLAKAIVAAYPEAE